MKKKNTIIFLGIIALLLVSAKYIPKKNAEDITQFEPKEIQANEIKNLKQENIILKILKILKLIIL